MELSEAVNEVLDISHLDFSPVCEVEEDDKRTCDGNNAEWWIVQMPRCGCPNAECFSCTPCMIRAREFIADEAACARCGVDIEYIEVTSL